MTTRFDQSLPQLVEVVVSQLGADALTSATFLRDAGGQLSVIVDASLGDDGIAALEDAVVTKIGRYAREDGAVRDRDSYGAARLLAEGASGRRLSVGDHSIAFLDRRTVGADWLLPPQPPTGIPRIAFASLKGGVGRSTSLAVLAAYLSGRGLRVLAVDLDLEAPGIGTMLISHDALPKYGTLDYLVENGIGGIDEAFVQDCIGRSFLGESGAQVSVLPAIGTATISNPAGALSKLGRAYLEDINSAGKQVSLTGQIREMLDRVTASNDFDIVLIDARAGLHETTAAALLGLGAEILLFGANEPQTFLGYRLLLAHMVRFHNGDYDEWRDRLQFVHAKASGDPAETADAESKFGDLYSLVYGVSDEVVAPDDLTEDDFEMVWADDETEILITEYREPTVLRVLDDSRYRGFDPLEKRDLLNQDLFSVTFGSLIEWVNELVPELASIEDGI